MMRLLFSSILALSLILSGCSGDSSDKLDLDQGQNKTNNNKTGDPKMQLPDEAISDIIKSIPSPLELTTLIKASGADFSKEILNNSDNSDNYSTTFKRALNLGVYGADLGYINIYEKTHISLSYLNSIKGLANELKVGQFFDFTTLRRLANANDNLDSVIYISTSGFENMDKYLKEKSRGDVSMLVLIGGWMEALYIATQVYDEKAEGGLKLRERIGEQKIVLDDLILLANMYKSDPDFEKMMNDLNQLKKVYEKVTIEYTYAEPETKEVDGVLMIVDNSNSKVNIDEALAQEIKISVQNARMKIIGQ